MTAMIIASQRKLKKTCCGLLLAQDSLHNANKNRFPSYKVMSEKSLRENPVLLLLRDPLSQVTRNERRLLLATSAIGIAVVKFGLKISEVPFFGLKFTEPNQYFLLWFILGVLVYFLIGFVLYAWIDIVSTRLAFQAAIPEFVQKLEESARKLEQVKPAVPVTKATLYWSGLSDTGFGRFTFGKYLSFFAHDIGWNVRTWGFEFLFPAGVALYVIRCLLWKLMIPAWLSRITFTVICLVLFLLWYLRVSHRYPPKRHHLSDLLKKNGQTDPPR